MTKASQEECTVRNMCGSAVRKLFELYPEGFPMDPSEAASLVENGFQVSWLLTPWSWAIKREVLKIWFDRGVVNLSATGDWVGSMSAQLESPDPLEFDALVASLPVEPTEPLRFLVRSAQHLIVLLRMEDSSVLHTDNGAVEGAAKIAHVLMRTAARGTSTWNEEAVAQAADILTIFQREGLPAF